MKKIFIVVLVLIIFFIPWVLGLGVSPGKIQLDFKPNSTVSFEITIINNPPKDQNVRLYTGLSHLDKDLFYEFENVVKLESENFLFSKNNPEKKVKVNVDFPEGFSKAGNHELRIGAMPLVSSREGIGIIAGNEIRLFINVSDEYASQKYAKKRKLQILRIDAPPVKSGERANISILIKSESDVELKDVYGKIKVLSEGKELGAVETGKYNIKPGEEIFLNSIFDTKNIQPSVLVLNAEVFYGSESVKSNGLLSIIGNENRGFEIKKTKFPWMILFIVIFVLILILIIIFLLFFLLRRKKESFQQTTASPEKGL